MNARFAHFRAIHDVSSFSLLFGNIRQETHESGGSSFPKNSELIHNSGWSDIRQDWTKKSLESNSYMTCLVLSKIHKWSWYQLFLPLS
jgi:hypothetical protein